MGQERKKQLESILGINIDMGASLEERLKLCTVVLDTIKYYEDAVNANAFTRKTILQKLVCCLQKEFSVSNVLSCLKQSHDEAIKSILLQRMDWLLLKESEISVLIPWLKLCRSHEQLRAEQLVQKRLCAVLKKSCSIEFPDLILYWKQTFGESEKIIEDRIDTLFKKCRAPKDVPKWFWDIVSGKLLIPPCAQSEFLNLVAKVYAVL